jgi:hypothetical protein
MWQIINIFYIIICKIIVSIFSFNILIIEVHTTVSQITKQSVQMHINK